MNYTLPRPVRRRFATAAFTATLLAGLPAAKAADFTWRDLSSNWSNASAWVQNTVPPSSAQTDLFFGGTGATPYISTNDIEPFILNTITLNSSATETNTITGASIQLRADGASEAMIRQIGSGSFAILNPLIAGDPLRLDGTGTGVVSLDGIISGESGLLVARGSWRLTNVENTLDGGITVLTGGILDLAPAGEGAQSVNINSGGVSIVGAGQGTNPITIDGGTLKLTTQGVGTITFGNNRQITFGTAGGVLDLTNSNPASPTTHSGNIAAGDNDLSLTLNNSGGAVAVVRFNGGQFGLSSVDAGRPGDWSAGNNVLRTEAPTGSGPLRIELTNGAGWLNRAATLNVPITVRGVSGGDPTSGPAGTVDANLSRNTGRMFVDVNSVTNYTQGLFFEGAVQVGVVGTARALDGNITVAGTSTGNAGYVVFSGRGTGTALGATIRPAGHGATGDAGQYPLYIGVGGNDTLTIETGGIAVFDSRIRHEVGSNNAVLLNARAVIQEGGELRISQSLSNATATASAQRGINSNAQVGHHIIDGNLQGNGTTASDAVINIQLPAASGADNNNDGVPDTFSNLGGVVFRSSSNLVVNGTGFGGLRVNATARPDALFGTGSDPVSNVAKVENLLTPARIEALTGTGGYLTVAPAGETYTVPNAEWAASQPVGLKVVNHAPGTDVVFGEAKRSWSHNIAVTAGAELSTGNSNFTMTGGTLHGTGTVSGSGGFVIGSGAVISPGLNNVGTLNLGTVTIGGTLLVDVTNAGAADRLSIGGNLTLGGTSTLQLAQGSSFDNGTYTVLTYTGERTGTFGALSNFPVGYNVSYETPGEIRLVFTAVQARVWNGTPGNVWSTDPGAANWKTNVAFSNGNEVLFDHTAVGSRTVVLNGVVQPASTTFTTNSTYTVTAGAGDSISGPGALVKNGTGTVELQGTHSYGRGTTVTAGTLRLMNNEVLPNAGAVVIAAGATLDVNGRTDTIGDLSVSGTVTAGNLSIGSLTLNGSGSIAANLVLGGNVTKSGSVSTVLPGSIDLGGSIRTFDVAQGTAPELTLSNVISNGGLSKVGPGELRLGSANTYTGGTSVEGGVVRALVARAIPTGALTISSGATADLGGFAHSFTNLNGAGTLLLGGATLPLNVTGNAAFDGVIEGAGALIKQGSGSLTLGGANSFETLTVEAGRVNLTNASAAGTGLLTVNSGATVQFGATLSNNVNVTSGTIASQFGGSITNGELTVSGNSQANTFNLTSNAGSELILAGSATLRGGGNLNVTTSPAQANADTGPGFRLRGTVASDYSGTITMQQRTKFEVQVDNAESPNPFGTGKLVMVGGTSTGGLNGTYSQFQARILTGGVTYQFANDVELSGAGYVNANMLGGADVRAQFRSLRIGDGQILGASKNDQSTRTLAFSSVTLTGGMAEFRAYDPAFAVQTNATRGGANIVLGAINESVGGSGIVFKAAEPHFNRIEGTAAYTGPTRVEAGTLQVGASGSLASSSSVFLDSTAKLDVTEHASGYTVPAAQLLTGPGDWDGRIVLSGTLAPGEGIGTMTGDDFTLNGGSLLKFQLSTADNQADLLEVTSFTKGSAGAFRFDFDGTGRTSGVYTLVRFGSTNFSAADFTITNLAPGLSGNIELSASELRLVLIPEPASALSLVLGAGTLLSMRRRRRP